MTEVATKEITIAGQTFAVAQPYAAGHTITEAEARALNQVRAENIGNNSRAKIKEMIEAGSPQDEIAAFVAEKDAEYVFTAGNIGESRKLDPYEREAEKIARELVKAKLAETGRKLTVAPEGVTEDDWKAKVQATVEQVAASENVLKVARKRVDDRKKQADTLLEAVSGADI